ncbi:MAG: O-antigen ligase family protein [Bacteroidales bacterium]
MFRRNIHNRILYFLLLGLAFAIPLFRIISSYIIVLVFLNWLLEGRFLQKFQDIRHSHHRLDTLLFSGLFFVYLAGLMYTDNMQEGLFSLQVKLPMFIFPLVFSTLQYDYWKGNRTVCILLAFVAGNVLASLLNLVWAAIQYASTHIPESFYYIRLSMFHHPSYSAMFLCLAEAILIWLLIRDGRRIKTGGKILVLALILFFSIMVILLSSKAGIISLILIFFLTVSYIIFIRRKYVFGIYLLLVISLVFIALLNFFPYSVMRFDSTRDIMQDESRITTDTREGTVERILIWKYSAELINRNFFFGTGTGDVTDALIDLYRKKDLAEALDKKLNAHNQYIQTFLALGLAGITVLLLTLILPGIFSVRKRGFIYFCFLMIIGFNMLVESMLERQAGVVFYSFFNAFLFAVFHAGEKEL